MKGREGFTLIEMVITLVIVVILAAILIPFLTEQIQQARISRAEADVKAIAEAISRFEGDVGRYPMFSSGSGLLQEGSADVIRLEGPGLAVTDTSSGASKWVSSLTTDALVDQLLANAPVYPTTSSLAKPFKWKGPYLEPRSDPWGNKYLVNIVNAKSSSAYAAFVLSAGPDGKVQTAFEISETSTFTASGDDILYRIR